MPRNFSKYQLNIKTPCVEIFSEYQRSINVSQTKEDLGIDTNIKMSLLGTVPQINPKTYTPLPEYTKSNLTKPFCSKNFKTES